MYNNKFLVKFSINYPKKINAHIFCFLFCGYLMGIRRKLITCQGMTYRIIIVLMITTIILITVVGIIMMIIIIIIIIIIKIIIILIIIIIIIIIKNI